MYGTFYVWKVFKGECDKHQIPNTCLCRSGFAQAGQSPNNNQIPMTKILKMGLIFICFGYLDIG